MWECASEPVPRRNAKGTSIIVEDEGVGWGVIPIEAARLGASRNRNREAAEAPEVLPKTAERSVYPLAADMADGTGGSGGPGGRWWVEGRGTESKGNGRK